MTLLSILLQAAEAMPTNIWTVGGALGLFAGVIAYLFKLYDKSQENRLTEIKGNFEQQINQLRKDLDEEKVSRRNLQDQMNQSLNGTIMNCKNTLEKVEDLLIEVSKKL